MFMTSMISANKEPEFKYLGGSKCRINIDSIEGTFPCFKYNCDNVLSFKGWDPMLWEDDDYIYVVGLPERLYEHHHITIDNETTGKSETFTSKNNFINWNEFFDEFVEDEYHSDLD